MRLLLDMKDCNGSISYWIKECIDDFPYVYSGPFGTKQTIKLREKRVATFDPHLSKIFLLKKQQKPQLTHFLCK